MRCVVGEEAGALEGEKKRQGKGAGQGKGKSAGILSSCLSLGIGFALPCPNANAIGHRTSKSHDRPRLADHERAATFSNKQVVLSQFNARTTPLPPKRTHSHYFISPSTQRATCLPRAP